MGRGNLIDQGVLAKGRVDASGERDQRLPSRALPGLIHLRRQVLPRVEFAVGRDHHRAMSGGRALLVAGGRDGDEHVVAIAERERVILEQLVVGEGLTGDLRLRDAEEDDQCAALGGLVAAQIRRESLSDQLWRELCGQGRGHSAHHLPRMEQATACQDLEVAVLSLDALHRAADPQRAAQFLIVRAKPAPEAPHATTSAR